MTPRGWIGVSGERVRARPAAPSACRPLESPAAGDAHRRPHDRHPPDRRLPDRVAGCAGERRHAPIGQRWRVNPTGVVRPPHQRGRPGQATHAPPTGPAPRQPRALCPAGPAHTSGEHPCRPKPAPTTRRPERPKVPARREMTTQARRRTRLRLTRGEPACRAGAWNWSTTSWWSATCPPWPARLDERAIMVRALRISPTTTGGSTRLGGLLTLAPPRPDGAADTARRTPWAPTRLRWEHDSGWSATLHPTGDHDRVVRYLPGQLVPAPTTVAHFVGRPGHRPRHRVGHRGVPPTSPGR